jgi:hypothetical protein
MKVLEKLDFPDYLYHFLVKESSQGKCEFTRVQRREEGISGSYLSYPDKELFHYNIHDEHT